MTLPVAVFYVEYHEEALQNFDERFRSFSRLHELGKVKAR